MSKYFDKTKFFGDWQGMTDELKVIFRLLQAEEVVKYIPSNAQFVTVVVAALVVDPEQLKTFKQPMRPSFIAGQNGIADEVDIGYLYHDGVNLVLVTPEKQVFNIPLNQISDVSTRLLPHGDWALVITIPTGVYIIGQFIQVEKPKGSTFRTFDKVVFNDPAMGWYKELVKLGVVPQKRQRQWNFYNLVISVVVIVGVAVFLWFELFKK